MIVQLKLLFSFEYPINLFAWVDILPIFIRQGSEFGLAVDICTDMYCADPEKPSYCIRVEAARGTSCASKKVKNTANIRGNTNTHHSLAQ